MRERSLSGSISATVSITPATGRFAGDGTGVATHLGRFTAPQQGAVAPAPDGRYAGRSTWTITAASGDTLTGTATLDVAGSPVCTRPR